ncbi:hypothetical protein BU15DRAFT_64186 [Melanogaster broomeanus]|nr:hypothetical protein BU15DRAFT_64186 [Melanogaster broomeanus]
MPRRSKQQQELITRYAESRAHYMKVFELNAAPLRGINQEVYDAAWARVTSQPGMIPEGSNWEPLPQDRARYQEELEQFSRYTASTVDNHIKLFLAAHKLLHMHANTIEALDQNTQDAISHKCNEIITPSTRLPLSSSRAQFNLLRCQHLELTTDVPAHNPVYDKRVSPFQRRILEFLFGARPESYTPSDWEREERIRRQHLRQGKMVPSFILEENSGLDVAAS